ncbi:MAG TPA: prolyl oligopeptidase family serine peptidase [Candidatus Sulfotelmatobacter sp.]|nr:prolyl oligopeptidase family serine peptidase [Candidatus Sulfotelmatobacter sp.]
MRIRTSLRFTLVIAFAMLASSICYTQTPSVVPAKPPVAPVHPVTDDYYSTKIVDNYRYMENLKDPEVQQWMREQAGYTRAALDSLPGRSALLTRSIDLMRMQQAIVSDIQIVAGHYYSLRTSSGSQVAGLYVRDGLSGTDRLLIDPEKDSDPRGTHSSISFYAPSPDNRYVVYGLSAGGSENAVLHVLDVASRKDTGETIDRARFAHPSWRDGRSFFYTQLQQVTPNMPDAARYQKSVSHLHVVGNNPDSDSTILGFGVSATVPLLPEEIPTVYAAPGTSYAVAVIRRGVEQPRRVYVAMLTGATGADIHWEPIAANYDDGIIAWKPASAGALPTHGETLYMISRRNSADGEIVSFDLSNPGHATPITILPAGKLPIEAIQCGRDAIYIQLMDGGADRLSRFAFARPRGPVAVGLPFPAAVRDVSTDSMTGGAVLYVGTWSRPPTYLRVEPDVEQASDAGLQPATPLDIADDLEIEEVKVKSWDGTEVPLSIRYKKGLVLDGSHPTRLLGYGAYGTSRTPGYNPMWRAALEQGVIFADAHVRGGGDYGEPWHLGGYKLTKPNTWRDFIACAEYLIAHRYTSPSKLFGIGDSAGGILIGRAIEERPDLFAAAVAEVPIADALRFETTRNGEGNVTEFGSVKTQEGFEDLYAMSPYAHVMDGVKYPAVLVTTAMNDNRVEPWLPAKLAARLQAATASGKPVLLRVDYDSGHGGVGATRSQVAETFADIISFALWQTGDPDFQPRRHP